ncbi:hypothetical protein A3H89_02845 [Candidatus Amesbacteria bacterium RIFCSPLOWO2_02_FULL_48_11]|uniref:Uncharacterized protein n=1 Tax=Candidatus Amesbacteria bacterium RIFOXYD1_FULL_47_9 TaxID=1797267 RepID=A0A1F5A2P2_9BACT|nr:MAG: hypothetical protein A2354_00795 [Candidatus Amesbacteria bacterium RIFOXYB1_FULL_47_12]OGD07837.1 MAG: hypothetical protein A3H89_02845 [Candidatus Amesbacteria bacterium RIFCSPLOWO2_02_FULL_48_11]OGD12346.1 MAG: hypothetical protein A2576_01020 [Candidatus Amesbacteria bacterium RIFOXYD1_FULL_47_9]
MKKLTFVFLFALLSILLTPEKASAVTYQKQACYTYKEGGVKQWKHCQTAKYNWDTSTHKVKCVSGFPVGTFTRYTGSWQAYLFSKGCQYSTWSTTGKTWHTFAVYKGGELHGYSEIFQKVYGNLPGNFYKSWNYYPQ